MNPTSETLLLVEDNEDDVFIFRRAFRQAQLPHLLQVVTDGQEASDYLLGQGDFADRTRFPLPFLVLLDLKLPLKHGLEVLHLIRAEPALRDLPVIVLTSSAEERDVQRARELGARAYLVKPPASATLRNAIEAVEQRRAGLPARQIPGDLLEAADAPVRPAMRST